MSVVAEVEEIIPVPIETVFARFLEYPQWSAWMPRMMRPLRGPARAIAPGDRVHLRIGGLPSQIAVEHVAAPHELRWAGGNPKLLHASHSFFMERLPDGSTRVRSVEVWTGALTRRRLFPRLLRLLAQRGGRQILRGYARWLVGELERPSKAS